MQINNPLQMNDWHLGKFFRVVLAIQLALWGVIGLDVIGLQIPILREFIGFIYLTFVPGITILRILKLHKLGNIETLLYAVGLSIATLMFTGLLMNTVYPLFGISGPISIMPLIITISAVVLVLCVLSYIRDKDFADPSFIDVGDVLSPPALFLCVIPFLAVFGTYLVNFHQNNILLMFLIVIIALIAILIGFDKFIQKNLYPLAVFIIAISLLYHNSLISMYLWGWDITHEYHVSNLVTIPGHWDSTIPYMTNAMLSIVMVAPIYSNILSLDLVWVFKIIYPLLFSLVPLGLYRIFQKQTDDKIAFLSCFFFVAFFTFYTEMLQLARQQIAALFFVLLILLMINKDMNKTKRAFLFIVFGFSLAVSHYGLSYIYMFCLILAWLILVLAENPEMQKMKDIFRSKFGRYKNEKLAGNPKSVKIDNRTISSTFVLLFITLTLAWYMYVSSSTAIKAIVHIGDHIASSIFTDFLNPVAAQGAELILRETVSPVASVHKYLQLLTQFLITVGIVSLIVNKKTKFEKEYAGFSVICFGILLASIAVPYFASAINTTRLYQITLFFLAPFCVIGGIAIFEILNKVAKMSWTSKSSLKVLSVLFAIFLLFNSSWINEVTKDNPRSVSLSNYMDHIVSNEREAVGGKWLSRFTDAESMVYGDTFTVRMLSYFYHVDKIWRPIIQISPENIERIEKNAYIYLRTWNIEKQEIYLVRGWGKAKHVNFEEVPELFSLIVAKNKVYDNAGSQIFQ